MPDLQNVKLVDSCDDEIYCGLPYILPVLNFLWVSHWLETVPFKAPEEALAVLNSKEIISSGVVRLNFTITGPDHLQLMFSPQPQFKLNGWSIDESTPLASSKKFKKRNMYFVYYSYGHMTKRNWTFYLDFSVPPSYAVKDPVVDLSVNGQIIHGDHKMNNQLKEFVSRLPDWTTTSAWTSTIRSYVF